MKILHIIPTLSSFSGGPAEVAINLVKELNALGAQAEILTTDDNGSTRFDIPLGKELTEFRGVPTRFFPRINPRLKEFIISPSAVSWLNTNMGKYDVLDIHYLFSFVPLVARSLARKKKIPYTVRTMGQLSPWALKQSSFKKDVFFALQERKNLEKADALHSTSKAEEQDIRNFGLKNKVINLPLGVRAPDKIADAAQILRKKYDIANDRFVLLFLSRLHYKKRPELAIEVVKEMRDRYNVHLILGGSGDATYERQLKQLVIKGGMADRVTFAGFVSGYEKELLLQGCDLFLLPSFSENFGIAVAEALAAGTPVVITPDVQIAEYVSMYDAGIITQGTTSAFTVAITSCFSDLNRMRDMQSNGLRLASEVFSWQAIAKQLLASYEEVLAGNLKG